MKTQLPKPW